jgi:hypothetical protein
VTKMPLSPLMYCRSTCRSDPVTDLRPMAEHNRLYGTTYPRSAKRQANNATSLARPALTRCPLISKTLPVFLRSVADAMGESATYRARTEILIGCLLQVTQNLAHWKSVPLLLGLACDRGRRRVLDLEPAGSPPRAVRRASNATLATLTLQGPATWRCWRRCAAPVRPEVEQPSAVKSRAEVTAPT